MALRLKHVFLVFVLCTGACAQTDEGLVAHWDFSRGSGNMLTDASGQGNNGTIYGAKWVKLADSYALKFAKPGDYVDFGDNPRLKLSGDMTLATWAKLEASPYPNSSTNWYIVRAEDYRKSGFEVRVDGGGCQFYYRSSQPGTFQHGLSKQKLLNDTFYHLVVVKKGDTISFMINGDPDIQFSVHPPAPGPAPFTISNASQPFQGLIADMRVYRRALSVSEILELYKADAGRMGKDTQSFGKLKATPFFRFDEDRILIEVDVRGVLPLKPSEQIVVELSPSGQAPIETREVRDIPESGKSDMVFALGELPAGEYEICALLKDANNVKTQDRVVFHTPPLPAEVISPKKEVVPALPSAAGPAQYDFALGAGGGGGFRIRIKDQIYPVESSYSYPHGGQNKLTAVKAPDDGKGESTWTVKTKMIDIAAYQVTASGKYYRIDRELSIEPTRVLVKDKITNISGEDLGIMLNNYIDVRGREGVKLQALGSPNPPAFVSAKDHGLGIVPLDDVYQLQQKTSAGQGVCAIEDNCFGLAAGASYTLEWAVYPTGTGDYYDLVNAVRKDEGLDNRTIDGAMAMTHTGRWVRESPPRELVEFGDLTYVASGCVNRIADDPGISLEGIEFIEYPKECEALRANYAEIKRLFPHLKVMFHIAQSLWATNKPNEIFPDSQVMAKSGKLEMYGSSGFSEERQKQGWAWYPYYPTLDNSFGKALLKSVDVMMDEIGVDGVFGDGLITGYGSASGGYPTGFVATYGKWDGHTVEIDPGTKTIRHKIGIIALLSREANIAYIRKINSKGGRVVINHMAVVPRSYARENAFYCAETNDGDRRCASLHLAPVVMGLANPNKFHTTQQIYDDIRAKLSWGALYMYYWWGGGSHLTHKMITAEMYPITVTEIHSGFVKGKDKLITAHSGVYGWPADKNLHYAVLFDARGHQAPCSFLTTMDDSSVRTKIVLRDNETAILKKIPIAIESGSPVNLIVEKYDADAILLTLNGNSDVNLQIGDGDFGIKPGAAFTFKTNSTKRVVADHLGKLNFATTLQGQLRLRIEPVAGE